MKFKTFSARETARHPHSSTRRCGMPIVWRVNSTAPTPPTRCPGSASGSYGAARPSPNSAIRGSTSKRGKMLVRPLKVPPMTVSNPVEATGKNELSRSLKPRHLTMISIGGIIGAGLFVSSSTSIIAGGPASFISYAITGLLILLVMRMLGEMTTALPHVRSFTEFARAGLGEGAGFIIGWLYWYFWVLVVPVEAIAGAKILQHWLPAFSPLQIGIGLMSVMTCVNLMSARSYAEFEVLFASIKVAAILVFMAIAA